MSFYDQMAKAFGVKLFRNRVKTVEAVVDVGCRLWCLVGEKKVRWQMNGSERLVSPCLSQLVIFTATGRPSSCSFEGQHAPRSPDPRTGDENTGSSGQPPEVGPTKLATIAVATKRGSVGRPATRGNRPLS